MFSPNPHPPNLSSFDGKNNFNSLNSRRRPRPSHQSQPSITATLTAHPPKKPRQRSVSAQRQLNASPEAQAILAASASGTPEQVTKQSDRKGVVIEWAKNEKYCVSQLSAIPMELRDRGDNLSKRMTATIDQTTGSALLVKDTGAYVWKYDESHPLPKPDHFPLPPDERANIDGTVPLALGTLVAPIANSDEPGFVVVMPVTGRIAYWDAVSSAIAEGLFTKKRGVEGKVDLERGETVQSICSIEPAGFVLCMTGGRLAHLALKDTTGKPTVVITPMRNYGTSISGIFGGLASVLRSGGNRREIAAIRSGRIINRSERELVVATTRGQFTQWEINRIGTAVIITDVDMREQILNRVLTLSPDLSNRDRDLFNVVDVVSDISSNSEALDVLVLTSFPPAYESSETECYYHLTMLSFFGGKCVIKGSLPITCYKVPFADHDEIRPRLYLPMPARTAFVVFSKAMVVMSIVPEDEYDTPGAQMMPYDSKAGFEDVIDFKQGENVEIIGSGFEDVTYDHPTRENSFGIGFDTVSDTRKKIYSPSILLVTKGAGILRCSVFDAEAPEFRPKPSIKPVPVKMKMEMAVFYGSNEKNLLNFNKRPETHYAFHEILLAAREVSKDILSSRSRYIPTNFPSTEAHLEFRARKLRCLAEYVKAVYGPLNQDTNWKLCWDAEKLEAARAVYTSYSNRSRMNRDTYQDLIKDAIIAQMQAHQALSDPSEAVSDWFTNHVLAIWEMLPYARVAYEGAGKKDEAIIAQRLDEANEMVLGALSSAFQFRLTNIELYNLESTLNEQQLPLFTGSTTAPWTSSPDILTMLGRQIDITDKLLDGLPTRREQERNLSSDRITDQLVGLVEIACRSFVERATWCESQEDLQIKASGSEVNERYLKSRNHWIRTLDKRDRPDQALDIAERYQDYQTLVELLFQEAVKLNHHLEEQSSESANSEKSKIQQQRDMVHDRIFEFFQKFGRDFAFTLYHYQIEQGNLKDLLQQFPAYKQYLTEFFHSDSQYAKLSWINDVSQGNFQEAGQTLASITNTESDLWCKTVQLSIGKLALMVDKNETEGQEISRTFDSRLTLIDLQSLFYGYLYPELRGAIDNQAGVELAMAAWGGSLKKRPTLYNIFKKALTKLVSRQAVDALGLINLLTLKSLDDEGFLAAAASDWPGEFALALQILQHSTLHETIQFEVQKTIWRRCYLRDDWTEVIDTKHKSEDDIKDSFRSTSAFSLLVYGFTKGLFEETSSYQPLPPQKTLFTQSQDDLKMTYPDVSDSVASSLASEVRQENTLLQDIVTKTQLDVWFEILLSEAKNAAEEEAQITVLDDSAIQGEGDSFVRAGDADEDMMDAD